MSDNPETINDVEAKAFNPFQNFIGMLDKDFQCKVVNVEFSAENAVKKL